VPWNSSLSTRSAGYAVPATEFNKLINNFNFLAEVNYTAFTSPVSITATTEATANQIVTSGAITYEAVPHMIEFFSSRYDAPAGQTMHIIVRDSTTVLGRITSVVPTANVTGLLAFRVTPTAASHTYNIAAHMTGAATGTIQAGAGGAGASVSGFIRISRIPT
jgi:hypothetical protein